MSIVSNVESFESAREHLFLKGEMSLKASVPRTRPLIFFFFFFWLLEVVCGILAPRPRIEPKSLAVEAKDHQGSPLSTDIKQTVFI